MKFFKKNWGKLLLLSFVVILPMISLANGEGKVCDPAGGKICNPLGSTDTIPKFIKIFLEGALKVGIPIVALAVIYCGFLFVEARGNSEKLNKAKDSLLYTLVGAGVLLGSWAIAELISSTVDALR